MADDAGSQSDLLKPCPESPNCVSSMADDNAHAISPIKFDGDIHTAKQKLLTIIQREPRTQIVKNNGHYIHATFKSFIFRFIDDVEFVFDEPAKVIHVRSASRTGYSDFGVNRNRVEKIREKFHLQDQSG